MLICESEHEVEKSQQVTLNYGSEEQNKTKQKCLNVRRLSLLPIPNEMPEKKPSQSESISEDALTMWAFCFVSHVLVIPCKSPDPPQIDQHNIKYSCNVHQSLITKSWNIFKTLRSSFSLGIP